mgnify:CR=1 FL=1
MKPVITIPNCAATHIKTGRRSWSALQFTSPLRPLIWWSSNIIRQIPDLQVGDLSYEKVSRRGAFFVAAFQRRLDRAPHGVRKVDHRMPRAKSAMTVPHIVRSHLEDKRLPADFGGALIVCRRTVSVRITTSVSLSLCLTACS